MPTDCIFQISKSYLHHEMDRGAKTAGVKRIRIHDDRVIIGTNQKKPSKIRGGADDFVLFFAMKQRNSNYLRRDWNGEWGFIPPIFGAVFS